MITLQLKYYNKESILLGTEILSLTNNRDNYLSFQSNSQTFNMNYELVESCLGEGKKYPTMNNSFFIATILFDTIEERNILIGIKNNIDITKTFKFIR